MNAQQGKDPSAEPRYFKFHDNVSSPVTNVFVRKIVALVPGKSQRGAKLAVGRKD